VPELQSLPLGQTIIPFRAAPDGVSFDVYDVVTQRFSSQHFVFSDGRVEAFPFEFRYAWPAELDLMSRLAGLTLRDRWAGWGASRSRVSARRTSPCTKSPNTHGRCSNPTRALW
jgi:hypothetical protein